MKKALIAGAATSLLALPLLAQAQAKAEPDYTFTGNMTVASEYLYRGIAQSTNKPAIQGGIDFAHKSGFYLGNWNSSISWLSDAVPGLSAPTEMDFYGGYKFSAGSFTFDPGVLYYYYPTKGVDLPVSPSTTEVYLGISWGPATFKYSYASTELFGLAGSKGSSYFDLNATFDLGSGFSVVPHVGYQDINTNEETGACLDGSKDYAYSDYSVKLNYALAGWTLGAMYSDTNAKKDCFYGAVSGIETGKGRLVLSVGKSF